MEVEGSFFPADKAHRRRFIPMPVQKDCFGYRKESDTEPEHCSALRELFCKNEERCGFYKTKEQVQREKEEYGE